jgi:hypothetical protein
VVSTPRLLKETPKTSEKSQRIFFRPFGDKVILPRFRRKSPQRKTHRFREARVFRRLLKIASVVGLVRSMQGRFCVCVPKPKAVQEHPKVGQVGLVLQTKAETACVVGLVRPNPTFLWVFVLIKERAQLYVPSERRGIKTHEPRGFGSLLNASKWGRPQW